MDHRILLEPEQEQLFRDLVEAERRVPRTQRERFFIANVSGPPGVLLLHPGWIDGERRIFEGDIETLARSGLIAITHPAADSTAFYVTPMGFAYYAELMRQLGKPVERLQVTTRDYVQNPGFQARHLAAYEKWAKAEGLLWSSDSAEQFTTIGHLLREAMQDFATALVERFHPPHVEQDKAKSIARLRAVLTQHRSSQGVDEFLEALLSYWRAVSNLVQRQEHGAQKERETLCWPDARRVVFQVAIVMLEIDSALVRERP